MPLFLRSSFMDSSVRRLAGWFQRFQQFRFRPLDAVGDSCRSTREHAFPSERLRSILQSSLWSRQCQSIKLLCANVAELPFFFQTTRLHASFENRVSHIIINRLFQNTRYIRFRYERAHLHLGHAKTEPRLVQALNLATNVTSFEVVVQFSTELRTTTTKTRRTRARSKAAASAL